MGQYRSIYDSYRLSNSSAIPLYEGSAAPEALQVGQHQQGIYDVALSGAMNTGANVDNVQSLTKDNTLALELRSRVQDKLKEFSTRGDYENMLPAVQQLAGEFTSRAKELYAPIAAYQDWNKTLDDEKKALTPEQKELLRQKAMSEYSGLQKDNTGRYVGTFRGQDIAANVDVPKWVDDRMKDIAIQKGGKEWFTDTNGDFIIKNGTKTERLSATQIKNTLRAAAQGDEALKAHIRQMKDLRGFQWSQQSSPDGLSPVGQEAVKKYLAQGRDMKTALKLAGEDVQEGVINGAIDNYGVSKYETHNEWDTKDLTINSFNLQDRLKEGEAPMSVDGPATKPLPDEGDLEKVSANMKDWGSQLGAIDKQMGLLKSNTSKDPTVVSQTQSQIAELERRRIGLQLSVNRAQGMQDFARNQTALNLSGGKMGFQEFVQHTSSKILPEIQKIMGNKVITTPSGQRINAAEVAEAIASGRATPLGYDSDARGVGHVYSGLEITLANGKKVKAGWNAFGPALGQKMDELMADKNTRLGEFSDTFKGQYKDNISKYEVSTPYYTLNEKQKTGINDLVNGAAGGIKLTMPGDFLNDIPEKKRPENLEVQLVKAVAPNGVVTVAVKGYNGTGKDREYVGTYEAHLSGSNAGAVLGNDWVKANAKGRAPWAAQAARNIQPGSGASVLETLPLSSGGIDLGTVSVGGKDIPGAKLKRDAYGQYKIEDANGNLINNSNGKPFSTPDIGEAGNWYDYLKKP